MKRITYNLINSGAYIGSKKVNWVPESEKFLVGYKSATAIYNVSIINYFFIKAKNFIQKSIALGCRGFFFGISIDLESSKFSNSFIDHTLIKLDQIVTNKNWRGGYITNTKFFRRYIFNGQKKFAFVVSFKFDYTNFPIINETSRINLPLIIPIDSNSSVISKIAYPIPSNSSSLGPALILMRVFSISVFKGFQQRVYFSAKRFKKLQPIKRLSNNNNIKKNYIKNGRRWNRTTAVSFSGLNSTIELSPFFDFLKWQNFLNLNFF